MTLTWRLEREEVQRGVPRGHGGPEVRAALGKQGVSVRVSSPEELAREAKAEYESLARLVKAANIKGD
jgi:tripartite-type tricarboxylate transporter receptor subunit TctC